MDLSEGDKKARAYIKEHKLKLLAAWTYDEVVDSLIQLAADKGLLSDDIERCIAGIDSATGIFSIHKLRDKDREFLADIEPHIRYTVPDNGR